MERLKEIAMRGLFALCLATSSPQPAYSLESPTQEVAEDPHTIELTDQNEYLRQAMIQSIYERFGIEIIADYDPQITAALRERHTDYYTTSNFSPTLEMVQTVDYVLNLVPAAGFMTQKIIFFEPPRNMPFGGGTFLPNLSEEGWIVLFHDPNILLSHLYEGTSQLDIPNYGTLMALNLAHEFGHGFHSNVLYLQSYDLEKYAKDWNNNYLNQEDPILRTYAEVSGFEFVEPEEDCIEQDEVEICGKIIRFQHHSFFPVIVTRNLDGWVRTNQSLSQRQISEYAKWSFAAEAFSEDFMGNLFQSSFYSPEMQQYFQNIFNGLATAEDPGHFLLAAAQKPEELLLSGIKH